MLTLQHAVLCPDKQGLFASKLGLYASIWPETVLRLLEVRYELPYIILNIKNEVVRYCSFLQMQRHISFERIRMKRYMLVFWVVAPYSYGY